MVFKNPVFFPPESSTFLREFEYISMIGGWCSLQDAQYPGASIPKPRHIPNLLVVWFMKITNHSLVWFIIPNIWDRWLNHEDFWNGLNHQPAKIVAFFNLRHIPIPPSRINPMSTAADLLLRIAGCDGGIRWPRWWWLVRVQKGGYWWWIDGQWWLIQWG